MDTSRSPVDAIQVEPQTARFIAPWWHTLLLLAFLLGFSALGSSGHQNLTHGLRMKLYLGTIIMEWLMVAYVYWGLRINRRLTMRQLIGGRWNKPEDFLVDVAFAILFRIVSAVVLLLVALALGVIHLGDAKDLASRLESVYPSGLTEQLVFQLLCVTAGFCEELIYRGYFQQQFTLLLRLEWAGVVLQALIFGGSHAYQGVQGMMIVTVLGFLFGVLAWWRKSLRPGMIAHFSQDSIAGLLGRWTLQHADKVLPK
jgi:membrane protease YdiL (CAAX protease family)